MNKFKTQVVRKLVLEVQITTDEWRAARCLATVEGLQLNAFAIRDAVENEHDPFVYWSNGIVTYSHERKGNVVKIYQECYGMKECV